MTNQDDDPKEVEEGSKVPKVDKTGPSKPSPSEIDKEIIGEYSPSIKIPPCSIFEECTSPSQQMDKEERMIPSFRAHLPEEWLGILL